MDAIKNYLTDMDGVLLRGTTLIPGAIEFIQRLRIKELPFLILTNNSQYTPRDLQVRLLYMGLEVPPEAIFTSALATAQFLHSQQPGGRAFVIGESGVNSLRSSLPRSPKGSPILAGKDSRKSASLQHRSPREATLRSTSA